MENKLFVKSRPNQIALNSNATKLAVIDLNSTLTLLVINNDGGTLENFEKKDVWNVKWAEDHPDQFVMMEKSRLYTVNGCQPDDPI